MIDFNHRGTENEVETGTFIREFREGMRIGGGALAEKWRGEKIGVSFF
jgi:hypothetical protein